MLLQAARTFSAFPEPPALRWTRRKRSAVERAVGIGADAAAAHRQPPVALKQQLAELDGDRDAAEEGGSAERETAEADGAALPQRQTQLPIGAFQRLPQARCNDTASACSQGLAEQTQDPLGMY